jgi:hypothetical protein
MRRKFGLALATAIAASAMVLLPGTAQAADGQFCETTWDQVGPLTYARDCINRSGGWVFGMTIFRNTSPTTQYLKATTNYIVTPTVSPSNTSYACSPSGWIAVNHNQDMGCAGPWIYVGNKPAYSWNLVQDWYSGGSTAVVSPTSA